MAARPGLKELRRTFKKRAELPPELHDWEQKLAVELLVRWLEFGAAVSRKGMWLRRHLKEEGPDYGYRMFKQYKRFVSHPVFTESLDNPPKPGSYRAWTNYMWWLKKLKLIELVEVQDRGGPFPRKYYKVARAKQKSPDWENPRWALYGSEEAGYT